jgi:hypothetical protein
VCPRCCDHENAFENQLLTDNPPPLWAFILPPMTPAAGFVYFFPLCVYSILLFVRENPLERVRRFHRLVIFKSGKTKGEITFIQMSTTCVFVCGRQNRDYLQMAKRARDSLRLFHLCDV